MNFVKATLVVAALGLAATAASANQASPQDCFKAERAVGDALKANASSPNYDAAKAEYGQGTRMCQTSFYNQGISHLNNAVALLTGH